MAKKEAIRWVGIFLFGSTIIGSLGERSFAFVPALAGFCLLVPALERKIAEFAEKKKFETYKATWFKPVAIVTMVLVIGATLPKSTSDSNKSGGDQVKQEVSKNESPAPTPAPIYNVPELLGKNIDEIRSTLGEPKDWTAPTKVQSDLISSWDMSFEKDGVALDVQYNIKTKVVDNLFLDGGDKKTLLAQGSLDEKSKDYVLKFVNQVNDKNNLLGVKIAKKLPDNLDADISTSLAGFTIKNKEERDWLGCEIKVNDRKYTYDKMWSVQAGDSQTISFADLATSDGTRFNVFATKPQNVYLRCNNSVQEGRWGFYSF